MPGSPHEGFFDPRRYDEQPVYRVMFDFSKEPFDPLVGFLVHDVVDRLDLGQIRRTQRALQRCDK